ncbi:hypothetical protein ACGF5F_32455 [Streptomyces sp. NPDC047821]|uniref:hypothetical protein n=1 Tax=Streptomyces sp. NPDC047821 TaxID=3365488 RepID=UPI0037148EC8
MNRPLATRALPTRQRISIPTTNTYSQGVDWVAVERVIYGDLPRPDLTRTEQLAATLLLIRAGWTEKRTAEVVGVQIRQVSRWKFEHGLGGARTCQVDGCGDQVKGRRLCYRHYRQDERRRKAAARPAKKKASTPREAAKCGTRSGYKRHLRENTVVCPPCRRANAEYALSQYHTTPQKEAA